MTHLKTFSLAMLFFLFLLCCFISGDRESDPAPPVRTVDTTDVTYKDGKPYGMKINHYGIKENINTEK